LFVSTQETEHVAYGWEKEWALNWTSSLLGVFLSRADHAEKTSSLTLCACLQKIQERSCRFVCNKSDQWLIG
jgi:hypothetical protein